MSLFVYQIIIIIGSNGGSTEGVLEKTAWVTGWVPGKKSQLRYVKETVKRVIVANWLNANGKKSGVIEPFLCTSENFYCITLKQPKWPLRQHKPKNTNFNRFTYFRI